jgi:hypothetical protein
MSGLYNMVNGVNACSVVICRLLDINFDKIDRFRDSGVDVDNKVAWIYARTGGNNRESYPNKELTSNRYYVKDYDDEFDNTYALYEFDISSFDGKEKEILDAVCKKSRPDWNEIFKRIGVAVDIED